MPLLRARPTVYLIFGRPFVVALLVALAEAVAAAEGPKDSLAKWWPW